MRMTHFSISLLIIELLFAGALEAQEAQHAPPAPAEMAPPPPLEAAPPTPVIDFAAEISKARQALTAEKHPQLAIRLLQKLLKPAVGTPHYVEIRFLMGEARTAQGLLELADKNYKIATRSYLQIKKAEPTPDPMFAIRSNIQRAKILRGQNEKRACDMLDDVRIAFEDMDTTLRQEVSFLHKKWHCEP